MKQNTFPIPDNEQYRKWNGYKINKLILYKEKTAILIDYVGETEISLIFRFTRVALIVLYAISFGCDDASHDELHCITFRAKSHLPIMDVG